MATWWDNHVCGTGVSAVAAVVVAAVAAVVVVEWHDTAWKVVVLLQMQVQVQGLVATGRATATVARAAERMCR